MLLSSILKVISPAFLGEAPEYIHTRGEHILLGLGIVALTLVCSILIGLLFCVWLHRNRKIFTVDHSSEIDEGTGMWNRYYLSRIYMTQIPRKKRHEYALVCIFANSEKVERIHGVMIDYIMYGAEYCRKLIGSHDFLTRIPGVGIVMLMHVHDEYLEHELPGLLQKIMKFNEIHNFLDFCRASAGIYRLRDEDDDINECVFNAWQTAEQAYNANEDLRFCSEEMLAAFDEERKMRREITKAFEAHEFQTYIQFYVDTATCRIVGGEALTRWIHPEKGMIPPMRFIPFMEREGIIPKLDYYILEEVCEFLEDMYSRGIENFYISCNFSRKTFSSFDFVDNCLEIFKKYTFPIHMIAFEMTESVSVKNVVQANNNAMRLKELGVKILLDDFGEGFASFYDLTEYPVDGLKIDKALVDNIHTVKGNTILRGMTRMGHELNMTVIVEGVESDDQVKELQNIKCDVIQGFRFHRPIPVKEAKETLIKLSETA